MISTLEIVSESRDVSALGETWERLFLTRPNEPSSSFEWTNALLQNHLHQGDRVFVVRLTSAGATVALAPLVCRRVPMGGWPVRLLFPLAERYNTHSDLLSESLDQDTVRAFWTGILRLDIPWDVFRLTNVLEENPLLTYFDGKALGRPLASHLRRGHASFVLDLPSTFDAYLAQRSAKFRNHLKRTQKRLESESSAVVEEFHRPSDVDRAYEMLLQIERASWKHDHGTAISAVPHQVGFYRELARGAAARGRLHLQFLLLAGEPVAYNLGYVAAGCYSYLKTSYVERLKALGVATFLRAELIRGLIACGIRRLDFPAEPYEWERQWTETVRWHTVMSLYNSTPAGMALAMLDRLRHRGGVKQTVHYTNPRPARAN